MDCPRIQGSWTQLQAPQEEQRCAVSPQSSEPTTPPADHHQDSSAWHKVLPQRREVASPIVKDSYMSPRDCFSDTNLALELSLGGAPAAVSLEAMQAALQQMVMTVLQAKLATRDLEVNQLRACLHQIQPSPPSVPWQSPGLPAPCEPTPQRPVIRPCPVPAVAAPLLTHPLLSNVQTSVPTHEVLRPRAFCTKLNADFLPATPPAPSLEYLSRIHLLSTFGPHKNARRALATSGMPGVAECKPCFPPPPPSPAEYPNSTHPVHFGSRSGRFAKCTSPGCVKSAVGRAGFCIGHGGGKRCQQEGCSKSALGRTMFCSAHGGGKRCMREGCAKSAIGSTEFCKAHGGGKRCTWEGCTKSAVGKTSYCIAHGGGNRCKVEGCTKSAQGGSGICFAHGGGRTCKHEGCVKSAQGPSDRCRAHGGGKRCEWEGCNKHALGSTRVCSAHGGSKSYSYKGSPRQ